MKFEFELDGDLFKKELYVDIPLKQMAREIKKDNEDNLKAPRSYDGSGLTPLKEGYYKKKKQKAGKQIFDGFRKGKDKLMNSIIDKKINDNEYHVTVNDKNKMIMYYLQTGAGNMAGQRKGFGINQTGIDRIFKKYPSKIKFK